MKRMNRNGKYIRKKEKNEIIIINANKIHTQHNNN